MAGIVEREAVDFDRPAPAADLVVLLDEDRILAQVIGGAETGGAGADDDGTLRSAHLAAVRRTTLHRAVNQLSHARRRGIPRGAPDHLAHLFLANGALLGGRRQRAFALRDQLLRRAPDIDDLAVRFHDVRDRRAYNELLRGHVLQ